jgi:hypothetical protein
LGAKPFPCPDPECSKAFDTAEHLRQHQRVNHDPHRYCCDICLDSIASNERLSEFGKAQKSESAYFATWSKFQQHNSEQHPPTCEHCHLQFQTNKQLNIHIDNFHHPEYISDNMAFNENTKMWDCGHPGCNHATKTQNGLRKHFRAKHDPQWQCRQNLVVFRTGDGSQDLVFLPPLRQDGARPDIPASSYTRVQGCERMFGDRIELKKHIRRQHLGERYRGGKWDTAVEESSEEEEEENEQASGGETAPAPGMMVSLGPGLTLQDLRQIIEAAHASQAGEAIFPVQTRTGIEDLGAPTAPATTTTTPTTATTPAMTGEETMVGNDVFLPAPGPASTSPLSLIDPRLLAPLRAPPANPNVVPAEVSDFNFNFNDWVTEDPGHHQHQHQH